MGRQASSASGSRILDDATRNFHHFVDQQIGALKVAGGPTCATLPASLSSEQVKHVRRVAAQYGLAFGFVGQGDARRPTVYQPGASDAPRPEELNIGMSQDEVLSRKLTSILRHRALEFGLEVTEEGWIRLSDILALDMFASSAVTSEDVDALIARKDQKNRFSLEWWEDELWIRANQGHTIRSIADELLLQPITSAEEVPCCVHGTYLFAWEQILRSGGLSRMTRNHIHFSPRIPGDDRVISGMRSDCEVAIFISMGSAMSVGIQFFRSSNDVILTPGDEQGMLLTAHFTHAVQLADNAVIWSPALDQIKNTSTIEPVQPNPRFVGQGQSRRW